MKKIEISVEIADIGNEGQIHSSLHTLMQRLHSVEDVSIERKNEKVPGSRGGLESLLQIVAYAASAGAFSAVYILLKDFHSSQRNVDIELKFEDGSSMNIKNLTEKDAQKKLEEHLARK